MTDDAWFGVTPEPVAKYVAQPHRVNKRFVVMVPHEKERHLLSLRRLTIFSIMCFVRLSCPFSAKLPMK